MAWPCMQKLLQSNHFVSVNIGSFCTRTSVCRVFAKHHRHRHADCLTVARESMYMDDDAGFDTVGNWMVMTIMVDCKVICV